MPPRRAALRLASGMVALVVLKLWLVAWQQVGAEGSARFDDALFVELAQHLKSGEWLGPYTERTLVKGPAYPLWLATVSLFGLPLLPTQQVLHALAAAAIVVSLRSLIRDGRARLALFAVLLFDPATYETTAMRVTREGLYTPLTMLAVAALVEIITRAQSRARAALAWGTVLGLVVGAFWLTREEGPWLLPALAIGLACAAVRAARTDGAGLWRRGAAIITVPLVVAVGCVASVAAMNYAHYGVPCVVELKSGWFERAYGAVTRVAPEHYVNHVPLSQESREVAYTASPAFAELRPYLDGPDESAGESSGEFSLSRFGEMTGTWFIWAFRDAAASAGHHETLPGARDYYLRMAREIDDACRSGAVPCGPSRASLAPPWRSEYFGVSLRAFGKLADITLDMRQIEIEQFPSVGGPEILAPFADVTHMRVEGMEPDANVRGVVRIEALRAVRDIYRFTLYPLTVLASLLLIVSTLTGIRARSAPQTVVMAWALLSAITARLALLAYISASSYSIYQGLYLRVLYPLLFTFVALSATSAYAQWRALRAPVDAETHDRLRVSSNERPATDGETLT